MKNSTSAYRLPLISFLNMWWLCLRFGCSKFLCFHDLFCGCLKCRCARYVKSFKSSVVFLEASFCAWLNSTNAKLVAYNLTNCMKSNNQTYPTNIFSLYIMLSLASDASCRNKVDEVENDSFWCQCSRCVGSYIFFSIFTIDFLSINWNEEGFGLNYSSLTIWSHVWGLNRIYFVFIFFLLRSHRQWTMDSDDGNAQVLCNKTLLDFISSSPSIHRITIIFVHC